MIPCVVLSLMLGVMVWHALAGQRGWLAIADKKQEMVTLRDELDGLQRIQAQLQQNVLALDEETLNLDVLEKHVRHQLGLYRENERVFHFSTE
ncbi:MAG: septum formation initiator family protein [Alphaproteobacteria bacterium GM7ARS4]|nr:septum formation initiator family protein [Alphaproteobacteria bacterium GM7ARS4]